MARVGFGLSDYWLIIRKRKLVAVLCFAAIYLSVFINVQRQAPVYRAVCSIRMIERKSVSDMITQMASYTSFDIMSSLTKILGGSPIIEKVVFELGLADENTPPEKLEGIILGIQGSVRAENELGTNIVNIIVQGSDPKMAADIANTIAKVYIKVDMEEKSERARNVRSFIEDQLAKSKKRLTEAENTLKAFRERGEATGVAVAIQNNITTLEREKMQLLKIYTEEYPDVVKVNEEITNLKKDLQALPESELEYARLIRELEVNEKTYLLLQSKLEEARIADEAEKVEDIKIVNPAVVPKSPIKPNKKLAMMMGLVIGLVVGVFMSFVVETLDTSIGTIDDLETLLKLPVLAVIPYMKSEIKKKHKWLKLFLQIGRGEKRSRQEAVEEMRQHLIIKHGQRSSITEAYRILRTNIKPRELIKDDKRIVLITSTIPREGKSITAINLSLALAQDGFRTLLIDCDLRKAVVHKMFGINKEPGLSDVLLGSSSPESAIKSLVDIMMSDPTIVENPANMAGLDNFSFLPCGKIVSNPAELLDSTEVKALFTTLKTQYDFLIVDSPPVLPVPDTLILGVKVADKVFLVYRAGYTSKMAILRAKEQLDLMKAIPSGVVLNSTTPESQLVSDYYHHYYHYRYYSDVEPGKKRG